MEMVIRPMVEADIPQVHVIDQLSFSLPWPQRSFSFELYENPTSRQWVMEIVDRDGNKKLIGMAIVWLVLDELHVGTIAVHPEFRKSGMGRKLLAHILLAAHGEGARRAYLEVRRSNFAAQKLYESFGFHIIGVRNRYYKNNGEDALLMDLDQLEEKTLLELSSSASNRESGAESTKRAGQPIIL
jgi:[ribosomal protein S18]-alanine N-acetyltransferase